MKNSKKTKLRNSQKAIRSNSTRNEIDAQIDHINQSVVAVGENISQTVTVADTLHFERLMGELTKAAKAQTHETNWPEIKSKIEELLTELSKKEPKIEHLQRLKDFFVKKGGQIKKAIEKIFSDPLVQKVVATAATLAAKTLINGL